MASQDIPSSPFALFEAWYKEALESTQPLDRRALHPKHASLATCPSEDQGQPACRTVESSFWTERGFAFFSSTVSRKAMELASNPNACLHYYWPFPVLRQVRVEGKVEQLPEKDAIDAFAQGPRFVQVGFDINYEVTRNGFKGTQAELTKLRKEMAAKYADESVPIPKPPEWMGYLLVPTRFEFHDAEDPTFLEVHKYVFTKDSTGSWNFELGDFSGKKKLK